MNDPFQAVRVSDRVYWVGAIDWSIQDFHGYLTSRGTTYNAYLVLADAITLIDTVKAPFREELLARVRSVVNPGDIRYVISNHAEMDHSGSLPEVIKVVKPEKVFTSTMGAKALGQHFGSGLDLTAVKDGDTLSLGNLALTFLETRMLHWPDSMVTYLAEEKLLFSQDGFGMHLASSERYADEIEENVLEREGAKYFANILLPYSPLVLKLLDRVGKLGIEINTIAPDHGPIWRKSLDAIIGWYAKWATQEPTDKAVIVYDTMWQSTEKMARAIAEGIAAGGARAKLLSLKSRHRSDVVTEVLDAGALLVGSPTMNNQMFPTVADVLTYLKGLKPQHLAGAAFGSYGWSGEAVGQIERILQEMKVELIGEGIKVQYVPDDELKRRCRALGEAVAGKIRKRARKGVGR